MNQENYKEIARINRECLSYLITLMRTYNTKLNKNSAPSKAKAVEVCYNRFKKTIIEQADYFEKEDKKYTGQFAGQKPPAGFNREQFLEWCGVKE